MSVTKVNADVFDLTDAYALSGTVAFSGTVTGTPLAGWEFISTITADNASDIVFESMTTGYDWSFVGSNMIAKTCLLYTSPSPRDS